MVVLDTKIHLCGTGKATGKPISLDANFCSDSQLPYKSRWFSFPEKGRRRALLCSDDYSKIRSMLDVRLAALAQDNCPHGYVWWSIFNAEEFINCCEHTLGDNLSFLREGMYDYKQFGPNLYFIIYGNTFPN